MATADQGLKENEADYYYSLPANQIDGEDVEYYYDEEDVDEEEDEVQVWYIVAPTRIASANIIKL